jgi:hypothetical protein
VQELVYEDLPDEEPAATPAAEPESAAASEPEPEWRADAEAALRREQ